MHLHDVNVLVYAYREDAAEHDPFRRWLQSELDSDSPYGFSELVLSGFLRVVTHPRVFDPPSPIGHALGFAEAIRTQPNAVRVTPGPRHWDIFSRLCQSANAKGNLVPDAYFAALSIEAGTEWITTDRDYSRFAGLKWRHPLRSEA